VRDVTAFSTLFSKAIPKLPMNCSPLVHEELRKLAAAKDGACSQKPAGNIG